MLKGNEQPSAPADWYISFGVVLAVLLTVMLGILFSLADNLQLGLTVPINPTLIAFARTSTPIPPTAQIPSRTLTSSPTAPPVTSAAVEIDASQTPLPESPTAVAVLAQQSCGIVPGDWVTYPVQRGDTLLKLSMNSGATISEIVQANCLDMNILYSGTLIFLPSSPPVRPSCGPPGSWNPYKIQPGDTLFSLARSHGTTVFAIKQANCMVSNRIYFDRTLYLPPLPGTAIPTIAPTSTPLATSTPQPPPKPTATDQPTATLMPTAIPTVTPSPVPSDTPGPTNTATPTSTPFVTSTATNTPDPTDTPTTIPENTATPTNTPVPTNTPTSLPTFTPSPTNTPTPDLEPAETPTLNPSPTLDLEPIEITPEKSFHSHDESISDF